MRADLYFRAPPAAPAASEFLWGIQTIKTLAERGGGSGSGHYAHTWQPPRILIAITGPTSAESSTPFTFPGA